MITTRITELPGVDYPIVQAPISWIARASPERSTSTSAATWTPPSRSPGRWRGGPMASNRALRSCARRWRRSRR